MKFLVLIISLFAIFGLSHLLDSSSIPIIEESDESTNIQIKEQKIALPLFSFQTSDGQHRSIKDFKGKVVILNFWATWCGPCEEEFPAMAQIVAENTEIALIAISGDESKKDFDKYLKRMKKSHPNLKNSQVYFSHDKSKEISSELFNVLRLPETFIINKNFEIVKKVIGSEPWTNGEMKSFLQKLSSLL